MSSTLYFAERERTQVVAREDNPYGNKQVILRAFESGFGKRIMIENVEITLDQWREINRLFDPPIVDLLNGPEK